MVSLRKFTGVGVADRRLVVGRPIVALTVAGEKVDLDAEPDEGKAAEADNVIGEVAVLSTRRCPIAIALDFIHAHPSLAESLRNAARMIAGILPPEV